MPIVAKWYIAFAVCTAFVFAGATKERDRIFSLCLMFLGWLGMALLIGW